MNKHQLTFAVHSACVIALTGAMTPVRAQRPPPQPPQQDLGMREHQMGELERAPAKKRDAKDVMAEVNDDLVRLGVLHEGITSALAASNQPLDAKTFVERAIEIKLRGTRLRTDLALPVDEKAQKHDVLKGIDNATLQPVLSVLDKLLD